MKRASLAVLVGALCCAGCDATKPAPREIAVTVTNGCLSFTNGPVTTYVYKFKGSSTDTNFDGALFQQLIQSATEARKNKD